MTRQGARRSHTHKRTSFRLHPSSTVVRLYTDRFCRRLGIKVWQMSVGQKEARPRSTARRSFAGKCQRIELCDVPTQADLHSAAAAAAAATVQHFFSGGGDDVGRWRGEGGGRRWAPSHRCVHRGWVRPSCCVLLPEKCATTLQYNTEYVSTRNKPYI